MIGIQENPGHNTVSMTMQYICFGNCWTDPYNVVYHFDWKL